MCKDGRRTAAQSLLSGLTVGWMLFTQHTTTFAQAYPLKPVRVVSSSAAGSLSDSVARLLFTRIGEVWGQQFIIDNRPAVAGSAAAELVARAPPDGYTLLSAVNSTLVVNPFLYSQLGYEPLRDFDAVSMFMKISEVLVVHPSLNVKTIAEFIALAKARPRQITYASAGNGHVQHLMMELFQRKAGIALVHVPYKGVSPAALAVAGGETAAINVGIGLARPHIVNGRLRALARTGFLSKEIWPDVPALTALYPAVEYIPWQAVLVPKGTSRAIITRLNAEVEKALAVPAVRSRMAELDVAPAGSTPGELDKTLRADLSVNRELVKSIGLKLD